MAKTMEAAVVHELGAPLRIEALPVPDPAEEASSTRSRRAVPAIQTCMPRAAATGP